MTTDRNLSTTIRAGDGGTPVSPDHPPHLVGRGGPLGDLPEGVFLHGYHSALTGQLPEGTQGASVHHGLPEPIGHGQDLENPCAAAVPIGALAAPLPFFSPATGAEATHQPLSHHPGQASRQEVGWDSHIQETGDGSRCVNGVDG